MTKIAAKPKIKDASEHEHQVALFNWAAMAEKKMPELKWMFAVPNAGKRSPRMGMYMRAEGLKKGVLDIVLPAPRGPFSGLFIELKSATGKATAEQLEWIDGLTKLGNKAVLCKGWEAAKQAIEVYLAQPVTIDFYSENSK